MLIECSRRYDKYAVIDRDKRLVDIQIVPKTGSPRVGQIYRGKVKHYNSAMHAAMILIGKDREVFLPSSRKLAVGDELLVQIVREEEKSKKAKASTDITIGGEYAVLIRGEDRVIVSKKNANDHDAQELARIIDETRASDYGILLRTKAHLDRLDEIRSELALLDKKFKATEEQGVGLKFDPYDPIVTVENILQEHRAKQILCNEEPFCKVLRKTFSGRSIEVVHQDRHLFDSYDVKLEDLLRRDHIYEDLRLSIDHLEALCVIDVNTGYMRPDALRENKILQVNQQAFIEILNLLELLGIGGMILIDFVSMDKIGQKKLEDFIEKKIKNHYNRDRKIISHSLAHSSMLQLVVEKSERDIIRTIGRDCTHCRGTGLLLNENALLDLFESEIHVRSKHQPQTELLVRLPRFISEKTLEEVRDLLSDHEGGYRLVYEDIDRIEMG